MDEYKAITNDWNYAYITWDLENLKCLVFVVQGIHILHISVLQSEA
jgi:hypothetical protein